MKTLAILALLACLVAMPAMAEPPPGKGKDKGRPAVEQPNYVPSQPGKGDPSGQVTSGCNHQANDIGLKGQERKSFVERCQARGGDAWGSAESGRNCRERADRTGLKGDAREDFIRRCREYRDDDAVATPYGKDGKKDEPAFNPRDKGANQKDR
jgi:hypothetical protein